MEVQVKDLSKAAYLMCLPKASYVTCVGRGKTLVFVFDVDMSPEALDKVWAAYMNDEAVVKVRAYQDAFNHLRDIVGMFRHNHINGE